MIKIETIKQIMAMRDDAGRITIDGDCEITCSVPMKDGMGISGVVVRGDLVVGGDLSVGGYLVVRGDLSADGDLSVRGDLSVGGDLSAGGEE